MNTFLPYESFPAAVAALDWKRLGKQRVEAMQILNILEGRNKGKAWTHHPAVLMWQGYEASLKYYLRCTIEEWIRRGYNNTMVLPKLEECSTEKPTWLTADLIRAMRSNLLRKDTAYYKAHGWTEPDNLPYVWPVTWRK